MKKLFLVLGLVLSAVAINAYGSTLEEAESAKNKGDIHKAIMIWKEVAKSGQEGDQILAAYCIAESYKKGTDVTQDFVQALYWYERAAQPASEEGKGDYFAIASGFEAGLMYYEGRDGVPRNMQKARFFWTESGKRGYSGSINAMEKVFGEKVF